MTHRLDGHPHTPDLGHVLLVNGTDWWELADGHRHLVGTAADARALAAAWDTYAALHPQHRAEFTVARVDTATLQGHPLDADHEWRCPQCGATTRARLADQGR